MSAGSKVSSDKEEMKEIALALIIFLAVFILASIVIGVFFGWGPVKLMAKFVFSLLF